MLIARRLLQGKRVLVTGATSRIGRAVAMELALAEARIGLVDVSATQLQAMAEELYPEAAVMALPCDVTDEDAVRAAIEGFADEMGGIDVVINGAGMSISGLFEETDMQVHRRLMEINYFGSLLVARHSMSRLEESGGSIVFVSNIAGKRGLPTRSGSSASWFAVHALFEALRGEWGPRGITVTLVALGPTEPEVTLRVLGPDGRPIAGMGEPQGRVWTPQRAARSILRAAAWRRREVVPTFGGKLVVWLNKIAPRLADRVSGRVDS